MAGVDEAGRGPLAGPVMAAAVILKKDSYITDLKDSKLLSQKRRRSLYKDITKQAIAWSTGAVDEEYIDKFNILRATKQAMAESIQSLSIAPDFVIIDALKLPDVNIPQDSVIKGDKICASIAAASIIAKVARDNIMIQYDEIYPEYGFKDHKGYGTKKHIEAIRRFGLCPIHRKSFSIKGLKFKIGTY